MPAFYADASALVKLVRSEAETAALLTFVQGADLISSALVLAEVPRAIRRATAGAPDAEVQMLEQAAAVLDAVALLPVDGTVLTAAGALSEPALRALDAIHVATALDVPGLDAFMSYDRRQSAVARLAGLRTVAPGVG